MKILMINGSPKGKRSNTYRLANAFLEGIRQGKNEEVLVQELQINQIEIKPCLGCFSCWSKTPGTCCIQDDMQMVIEKLLWADVVIWSFPLYYFSVPGGLKNMIDRQLPMVLPFMVSDAESGSHPARYDTSQKKHVIISTCGFYTAKGNYEGVTAMFDHMCGKENYTAVFCGQGELFRVPEFAKRTEEYLEFVRAAGTEYLQGGISEETREKLDTLLLPREVFESLADASWGVDKETGEQEEEAFIFTKQMAALYRKEAFTGKELVLEMYYTDKDLCYQIILDAEGSHVRKEDFKTFTTRIETPYTIWNDIATGKISGEEALMQQLYKVKGDFNLMLRWDDYFSSVQTASEGSSQKKTEEQTSSYLPKKGTNMNILLLPWIVFWVAAAIDGTIGSCISIAVCVLVPVLFFQNKKTFYDVLSSVFVTGYSILLLLGGSQRMILPVSYLTFGIMWTVSCFLKVPLTAHYSMNDYNGEKALKNSLFMKTNWILTLMWGILYLLTPIWTYFIMGTEVSSYVGAINSVLPAVMGVFTAWFQKWYPAKVAQG